MAEFLMFILILIASPCNVFGGTKYERDSLKAMSGVRVSVSDLDKTLQTHGMTEAQQKGKTRLRPAVMRTTERWAMARGQGDYRMKSSIGGCRAAVLALKNERSFRRQAGGHHLTEWTGAVLVL